MEKDNSKPTKFSLTNHDKGLMTERAKPLDSTPQPQSLESKKQVIREIYK